MLAILAGVLMGACAALAALLAANPKQPVPVLVPVPVPVEEDDDE